MHVCSTFICFCLQDSCNFQENGDIFLSLVNKEKLSRIMAYVMNEETFLSTFGVRSLSKVMYSVHYENMPMQDTKLFRSCKN